MTLDEQIEIICDALIEANVFGDGDIHTAEIMTIIDKIPYKTIFDVCFFRGEYIYDVQSSKEVSYNTYANEILDDINLN